jgi:pseudouridine-5'-phosphate glycosidase
MVFLGGLRGALLAVHWTYWLECLLRGWHEVMAGVPIPAEHEAEGAAVERAIGAALRDADVAGVSGAAVRSRTLPPLAGGSGRHLGRRLLHVCT